MLQPGAHTFSPEEGPSGPLELWCLLRPSLLHRHRSRRLRSGRRARRLARRHWQAEREREREWAVREGSEPFFVEINEVLHFRYFPSYNPLYSPFKILFLVPKTLELGMN